MGAYIGTGSADSSYIYYGDITTWEVPYTGVYEIEAYGARGGYAYHIKSGTIKNTYPGCSGAYVKAQYKLTKGQKLRLLAGKPGGERNYHDSTRYIAGAGGGGSFVVLCNDSSCSSPVPLVIAGGGGGADPNDGTACTGGQASNSGSAGYTAGGSSGADGTDNSCTGMGGHGWNTIKSAFSGSTPSTTAAYGEKARDDGSCSTYSGNDPHGGFGGGGSAYYESNWGDAGGGGGYSGGGAGNDNVNGGGGGGSFYDDDSSRFISGSNSWTAESNSGNGKIVITMIKRPGCTSSCGINNDTLEDCKSRTRNCEIPENTELWTPGPITQTYSGSWTPSETGGSYSGSYSSATCAYKCASGYHRENSECISNTKVVACPMIPITHPDNAQWNTVSIIQQDWDGTAWTPSDATEYDDTPTDSACRFKCKSGYDWYDGDCVNERTIDCTNLPAGAEWNNTGTKGKITQSYNGSTWLPAATQSYNTTSSNSCVYKCKTNYTWDGTECKGDTQTAACGTLPENAEWWATTSDSLNITQTFDGSWSPATTPSYSTAANSNHCVYKCKSGFHTENNRDCISNSRTFTCTGKPDTADWWNNAISQTWDGTKWTPDSTASYSDTSQSDKCVYHCASSYHLEDGQCKSNTKTDRADDVCEGLPSNASWNPGTITQTWDTANGVWKPSTTGYPQNDSTHSTTDYPCRFTCNSGYRWENSMCSQYIWDWGFESTSYTGIVKGVTNSGYSWSRTTSYKHSGSYSICSGNAGYDSSSSGMTVTVDLPSPGTLSFYIYGASENCCDKLAFSIDGGSSVTYVNPSGWEEKFFTLPAGSHTLKFTYSKDISVSTGIDKYCVDDLHFVGNVTDPVFLKLNEGSGTTTLNSGANGGSFSVSGGSWTTGKHGNAYNFTGNTQINTGMNTHTFADSFTIMAWVKVADGKTITLPSQSSSGTNGTSGEYYLFGANHEGANCGAGLSVGTNGIFVTAHGDGYMPPLAVYSGSLGTDWHHVAVVFSNKVPTIYLDGGSVMTGAAANHGTLYAPTVIGGGSYGNFSGALDDVRIIGKALTATEIYSLMNSAN